MLKIGVAISGQVADAGECLADARALEAAGVDSIWVDRRSGLDPWMLVAGIAAITGRVRLAVAIDPADGTPEVLSQRVSTLHRLSRGRAMLRMGIGATDEIIAVARRAGSLVLALEAGDDESYERAAKLADGVVHPGEMPAATGAAFRRVLELRPRDRGAASLELWTHVPAPDARAGWNEALRASEDAGATGVIVPFGPRLLDLLRRPDEEDDRSDLLVAQG